MRHSYDFFFIELRSGVDVKQAVEKAVAEMEGETVGSVATVQHVHALNEAKVVLARTGKKAVIVIPTINCKSRD